MLDWLDIDMFNLYYALCNLLPCEMHMLFTVIFTFCKQNKKHLIEKQTNQKLL